MGDRFVVKCTHQPTGRQKVLGPLKNQTVAELKEECKKTIMQIVDYYEEHQ